MIIPVGRETERAWAELCAELWPHHEIGEFLSERKAGGYQHEYLYLVDERPIAFISLSLRHDYVEGTSSRPVGYIEGIYVRQEHRKMGIARELVAFARRWSAERGCAELASDCLLENEVSRAFHRRVGFQEANVIVCFTMSTQS